jgi:hypothetical protein
VIGRKRAVKKSAGRVTLSRKGVGYRQNGDNALCKESLHKDFDRRCAYCLWHADSNRDEFEIDHFCPSSRGGLHKYGNLRLSCGSCNRYKGNLPTDKQRLAGERILDPCAEWDYGHHLVECQDHTLAACTPEGCFHLARLRLNCLKLVEARRKRDKKIETCEKLARKLAGGDNDTHRIVGLAFLREARRELAIMLPTQVALLAHRPLTATA